MTARVASVNVGRPRPVDTGRRVGRDRDLEAARRRAGSPSAASTSTATTRPTGRCTAARTRRSTPTRSRRSGWWEAELGRELGAAAFGENLTTEGIDVSGALVGERWRIGTTLLEVVQPRLPCFKLGLRIGDPAFVKRFAHASRPGAYLRIVEEGELGAGDAIEVDLAALPGPRRLDAAAVRRDPARRHA